jgi:hypothetical protein
LVVAVVRPNIVLITLDLRVTVVPVVDVLADNKIVVVGRSVVQVPRVKVTTDSIKVIRGTPVVVVVQVKPVTVVELHKGMVVTV